MKVLLALRDSLSRFYGKYDTYIRWVAKCVLAVCAFGGINVSLGQMERLNNPLLVLGMAVICAFFPTNSIVLVGTGLVLGHFYALSAEAALVGGGMLVVGVMLYFGIATRSSVPLIVTMLALAWNVPSASAVVLGLTGGPLTAVGSIFGTFGYYLIRIIGERGGNLQSAAATPAEALVEKSTILMDAVIQNREMILVAVAVTVTLAVVWMIRRMPIKYAWMVAAAAGCLLYLVMRILGASFVGGVADLFALVAEVLISMAVAWMSQTMLFSLDYKRVENVRFEDDEYFYYVKAVPKKKVRKKRRSRRADRR